MHFAHSLTPLLRRIRFGRAVIGTVVLALLSFGSAAAQTGDLQTLIAGGELSPDAQQSQFTSDLCFISTVSAQIGFVTDPSNYPSGVPAPNASSVSVSADGRYIVFQSDADNLVTTSSIGGADTNKATDVFRYDRLTCTTERVSLGNNEEEGRFFNCPAPSGECVGQGWSRRPSISADGRYVSFTALANNFVPNDTNTHRDIFVRDLVNLTTVRASVSTHNDTSGNPIQAYSPSDGSTISPDGRYVAFYSHSAGLLATAISTGPNGISYTSTDTNTFCQHDTDPTPESCYDVFVRDTLTNQTERVSIGNNEEEGNNDSGQDVLDIQTIVPIDHIGFSQDGRHIAFVSKASNFVPNDTNGVADIFVRDRTAGTTVRVSVASNGTQGNQASNYPDITPNGQVVVFESLANNLLTGADPNDIKDIFARDLTTNITTVVSVTTYGAFVGQQNFQPSISADGRYVAYTSDSSNLEMPPATDNNGFQDVYVTDRVTGHTRIISSRFDGTQGNGGSFVAEIADNGQFVAFESDASNLISGDTNNARDAFVSEWRNISFEPDANMIFNSTFGTPPNAADTLKGWSVFGIPDNPIVNTASYQLEFYRQSNSLQGVVLQNTFHYLWANSPIEAQVQAGNTSAQRKRLTILVHDGDFSDLQVCSFWIPPNSPLRTYVLRSKTNENWTNATISLYASNPDNLPALVVDNVLMAYRPQLNQLQTRSECLDPEAPLPTAGDTTENLVGNGGFDGGTFTPWAVFNPVGVDNGMIASINSGVVNMYRGNPEQAGSLLQNTGVTNITADTPLELRLRLGNSSALRKRVTILLHASDFSDLQVCTFWLQPNTPLDTYVMRTHTTTNWSSGASVSFYIATADNTPAVLLDDVDLRAVPSLSIGGTACYLPGSGVLTDREGIEDALRPTLQATATWQPYVPPDAPAEIPLFMTPTPTLPPSSEGDFGEEGTGEAPPPELIIPSETPLPTATSAELPTEVPPTEEPPAPPPVESGVGEV